ncbi:MAG TPA: SUMF1/EgtB/PvdO family nonheme iron enzyme [Polyangiaceae bacterium]|nr:SUMF1/EgtB/PvdO family nonheme iron enzyme [Polyangiaceae bacterium]
MRLSVCMALCLCAGCRDLPPQGQVLLYVDTDATLAAATGETVDPTALFDSLRIDVFEPGQTEPCAGCSRTFALDRAVVSAVQASFGLPMEPNVAGYRVRLRLYHSASTLTGSVPNADDQGRAPQSTIDTIVSLPMVEEEGIVERSVVLRTNDIGMSIGTLDAPVEPLEGAPLQSLVGSWPGARRVPCSGAPEPGEVCVPGGAFWMGNARMLGTSLGEANDRRRLVVLSPFFLDSTEVTVSAYRSFDDGSLYELHAWSGGTQGFAWQDFCTFTATPGAHDDKPVLCVSYEGARAYCQARGGDLPSEAQIEYAASALESRLFVWGSDQPRCSDAVLQRYGYGLFAATYNECTPELAPGGAEIVGSLAMPPRRDRLELEGGVIYDLVGNATEWALDTWNRQDEPCWMRAGPLVDPWCNQPSPSQGDVRVFRTGSWLVGARQAAAAYRSPLLGNIASGQGIDLGFRCARRGITP